MAILSKLGNRFEKTHDYDHFIVHDKGQFEILIVINGFKNYK